MDQKKKNILLVTVLIVALGGLACFLIIGQKSHKDEVVTESWVDPLITQKDTVSREAEQITVLQKTLFTGKTFIATTSNSNNTVDFEFRSDGTFKGYTKQEYDDLGSWDVEADPDGTYLVINTLNTTDRYLIGYNNNDDITLTDTENKTYVLSEKVR